jgi:hypothetical protein
MNNIERYKLTKKDDGCYGDDYCAMEISKEGDFVTFADYESLRQQLAEQTSAELIGYVVPDFMQVYEARNGSTLMSKVKTDLHTVPVYTAPPSVEVLLEALRELNNWLVCWPIATAEDMAQSFEHMNHVATDALSAYKPTEGCHENN